jgi:hypothetical protein
MPALLQQVMDYIELNGFVFMEYSIIIDIRKLVS